MEPKQLVIQFVNYKLDGNIDNLVDFDLKCVRNDAMYGCPGRKFDCDDTNIMRAIYCLVFCNVWQNLTMENSGEGKLRGDTINSSATFFSYPWDDKFTEKWNPPTELKDKIHTFQHTFHTIGNMTILPDKRIGEWSINKHRGCHDDMHDYEDRFLNALHKVLTMKEGYDEDLNELVTLNQEDFKPFFGEEGWKRYIDGNLLDYYVDDDYTPIITSKGYTYWRGGYTNRERFFEEAHRYIDDSTSIIYNRGKRIIEKLKQKLQ